MKNQTESINDIIFTCFPPAADKTFASSSSKLARLVVGVLQQKVLVYRNQLQNSIAALGIGAILLLSVYLFLSQLAEYGWQ